MNPKRKHLAHCPLVKYETLIVILTVCAHNKKPILASPEMHKLLVSSWRRYQNWLVSRYVIMPDHIHLLATPSADLPSLKGWVTAWKRFCTRRAGKELWQKDYWDRQVRSGENLHQKWEYIRNNPVRAGLCAKVDDWPYAGQLFELGWWRDMR